ncbi:MAG: F0F1 ATP synthase subunit gamma [Candidatus Moranbacteria bacterium]|nr:F0F1 ATP synthase subunit gamma [Candidatus Moranbacteria bacterium]
MNSARDIKRRIKSINNTKKITRAMEMVSAAKMRRSVASVVGIRPYAHSAWSVLTNLARAFKDYREGLLEVREVKSVLVIAIASNRGLCGSFNAQVAKKIKDEINNPDKLKINRIGDKKIESTVPNSELKIDFITIGKKGEAMVRRLDKEIVATFPELTYLPKIEDVRAVAKIVIEEYLAKKYDKVAVIYTDFVSAINQQTRIRQILPVSKIDLEKQIAEMDALAKEVGLKEPELEYKIEPSPKELLDYIFPRLIEMQIYHAILESNASKESSRMLAMRNATDAAGEMADGLTLAYNQLRQAKITQEIAEISAGKATLEG